MQRAGGEITTRRADDAEFALALRAKLLEEAREVVDAVGGDAILEELADVLEVVRELARLEGADIDDVQRLAAAKAATHGRFDGRLVTVSYRAPDVGSGAAAS